MFCTGGTSACSLLETVSKQQFSAFSSFLCPPSFLHRPGAEDGCLILMLLALVLKYSLLSYPDELAAMTGVTGSASPAKAQKLHCNMAGPHRERTHRSSHRCSCD